jgi:hypothetical protein
MEVLDAMKAFDLAFTFAEGDSKMAHRLFLIKAGVFSNSCAAAVHSNFR